MATAGTQATGNAAETLSAAQTAGFLGWSPGNADRSMHSVVGGNYKGTYANSTAYAVGDVVLYNGATYRALQTVTSANSTAPALGSVWGDATNHRGLAESTTDSHAQFYR